MYHPEADQKATPLQPSGENADNTGGKENIMDLIGNVKNIGSKLNERKPGEGNAKVRRVPADRTPPNRKADDAKIPEGRVGLMLDVNA